MKIMQKSKKLENAIAFIFLNNSKKQGGAFLAKHSSIDFWSP